MHNFALLVTIRALTTHRRLHDVAVLCQRVMPSACIDALGPLGCHTALMAGVPYDTQPHSSPPLPHDSKPPRQPGIIAAVGGGGGDGGSGGGGGGGGGGSRPGRTAVLGGVLACALGGESHLVAR